MQDKNHAAYILTDLAVFLDIYKRIAEHINSDKQADIADALGMKASHISNLLSVARGKTLSKGPTTLPYKQLIVWALHEGVSVDWLLTGVEPCADLQAVAAGGDVVHRAHAPHDTTPPPPDLARDVSMAWSVLESGTGEADALRSNTYSFYKGAFGIEALADQLGIDGLPPAYKKEYLALKGGGGHVQKWSGEMVQKDEPNGNGAPKRRRTKTS